MPFIKNVGIFAKKVVSISVPLPIISAGDFHNLAIDKNGRSWAWGDNTYVQLGDNSTIQKNTPVSVAGAVKTFCKIFAGAYHSTAIDKNGRAWSWGYNFSGELGDNSTTNRCTPVSVAGAVKTFCKISAGSQNTSAIDKNGIAWGWGINSYGQIGDNSVISKITPVSVLGSVKTFCQIIASFGNYTIAIDKNGRAWSWGNNQFGQLGDNSITSRLTPVSVLGAVKTFCEIAANGYHTAAIDKNGRAWSWGYNQFGQLGDNSIISKRTPVSVLGVVKTFCEISSGTYQTLAIDKNGQVWGWGVNNVGQLGDDSRTSRRTPVSVRGATKTFCKISAGQCHTIAVDKNGKIWAWGFGLSGQLGNDTIVSKITPVSILGATKTFFNIVSSKYFHVLAIDKNGRLWSWGRNVYGELGDNSSVFKTTPVSILGTVKTFCQISGGESHSTGIDKNGRVWSWGYNQFGQLGTNSTISRITPVSILGTVKTFCKISAGSQNTSAIDKNGIVWGWGRNTSGRLGDNSTTQRNTPVSVVGATKTFCEISSGFDHVVAIDKNGRAWSWGSNLNGQLGDNSLLQKCTPVSVAGATKTFCKISGANQHTIALDKNGRAWSWGANTSGQLGDNSTTRRITPVSVAGAVKTFCKIANGFDFSVALDKNGRVWSWGNNQFGQLGDNSIISKRTPVSVLGVVKTFCEISTGRDHTVAMDKNGRVWSWGSNSIGQLGINEGIRLTPVQVCVL